MAERWEASRDQHNSEIEIGTGQFMVTVSVGRRVEQELVVSAEVAQTRAADLAEQLPTAHVSWMSKPDLPSVAYFAGRYAAGITGIRDLERVTHVFALAPGMRVDRDTALIALCGEPIRSPFVEIVSIEAGHPCWRCRAKMPGPETPDVSKPSGVVLPMSGPLPEHDPHRTLGRDTELPKDWVSRPTRRAATVARSGSAPVVNGYAHSVSLCQVDGDDRGNQIGTAGLLPTRIPHSVPRSLSTPPEPMNDPELLARIRDALHRSLGTP